MEDENMLTKYCPLCLVSFFPCILDPARFLSLRVVVHALFLFGPISTLLVKKNQNRNLPKDKTRFHLRQSSSTEKTQGNHIQTQPPSRSQLIDKEEDRYDDGRGTSAELPCYPT